MYTDLYRPKGFEHELMLSLPFSAGRRTPGPGKTLRMFLFRGPGSDFSEADRALLTLLRPHVHQAYLDAERRRHPVPELTPRQWQLMDLLAAGHTSEQIARRLNDRGHRPQTPGKHLPTSAGIQPHRRTNARLPAPVAALPPPISASSYVR
jgi:Bacterial regulatory proteins, luxR family